MRRGQLGELVQSEHYHAGAAKVGWPQVGGGLAGNLPSMTTSRSFDQYPQKMTSEQVAGLLGHPRRQIEIRAREGILPAWKSRGPDGGRSTGTS